VFHHVGILRKIWLSPENSTGEEMICLARAMRRKGARVLNLFFHSPTLLPGLTPFVKSKPEADEFLERIRKFLRFAIEAGVEPIALGDTPQFV
jgi:hypothetical protein